MIVRERGEHFLIINQHDHAQIAGEIALHWRKRPEPLDATILAIRNHDVGWNHLDDRIRWNPASNKPYSFMDLPRELKLPAYTAGIDQVEAIDPYAAYLCSLHYLSFVEGDPEGEAFVRAERARHKRLIDRFASTPGALSNVQENLELLKTCDRISLFLCLNEAGENSFPWYREGIKCGENLLVPQWVERTVVRFDPNPFTGHFEIRIPASIVDRQGQPVSNDEITIQVITG